MFQDISKTKSHSPVRAALACLIVLRLRISRDLSQGGVHWECTPPLRPRHQYFRLSMWTFGPMDQQRQCRTKCNAYYIWSTDLCVLCDKYLQHPYRYYKVIGKITATTKANLMRRVFSSLRFNVLTYYLREGSALISVWFQQIFNGISTFFYS